MPYKTGMILPGEVKLGFNAVVFATADEAETAGTELMSRWTMPTGFTVVEVDQVANYEIIDGRPSPIGI